MEEKTRICEKVVRTFTILFLLPLCLSQIPESIIVLQNQYGDCNSIWNPQRQLLQDRDEYIVVSQTEEQQYYFDERNCVVQIVGKVNYQWAIRIISFDIDSRAVLNSDGTPKECGDFVKLYDSERPDNAKVLKGVNRMSGICGTLTETQLQALTFQTCSNKLTIQFKTDNHPEFKTGFTLELRQYPWANPTGGPDCDRSLSGISQGGWHDGTNNEFQNNWDEQPVIPGYVQPGGGNDYDKEVGGITCYECSLCPVEPFEPEKDSTAQKGGCYACSKEWDDEYYSARRKCYTSLDYFNLLESFRDVTEPYLGCQKIQNDYGRTLNYCFCNGNLCNTAVKVSGSIIGVLFTVVSLLLTNVLTCTNS